MKHSSVHVLKSAGMATALTWFGHHCGSGFATGTTMTSYVTRYGFWGILIPIGAFLGLGLMYYFAMEAARLTSAKNYKEFAVNVYPFGKLFGLFWDALIILATITTLGVVFAGGASLLEEQYGVNYILGLVLFAGVCALIIGFASDDAIKKILNVLSAVTTPMIILLLIVSISGIIQNWPSLAVLPITSGFAERYGPLDTLVGIKNYIGLQGTAVATLIVATTVFTQGQKDSLIAATFGSIINALMMILMALLIFTYYPETNTETLPVLYVIKHLKMGPFLSICYQLALLLALLSTGGSQLLGGTARFSEIGGSFLKTETARRRFWCILFCVISGILAAFGILFVVQRGYGLLAQLSFPVIWLLGLIFASYKVISIWKEFHANRKDKVGGNQK